MYFSHSLEHALPISCRHQSVLLSNGIECGSGQGGEEGVLGEDQQLQRLEMKSGERHANPAAAGVRTNQGQAQLQGEGKRRAENLQNPSLYGVHGAGLAPAETQLSPVRLQMSWSLCLGRWKQTGQVRNMLKGQCSATLLMWLWVSLFVPLRDSVSSVVMAADLAICLQERAKHPTLQCVEGLS